MNTSNEIDSQTPGELTSPASLQARKLGIASLTLGILGLVLYFLPFIAGYIMGYIAGLNGASDTVDRFDPINVIGWFVSWCGNFSGLAALILGSISVAREKKNVFGIAGIVVGTLLTCGCLATIAYNLSQM